MTAFTPRRGGPAIAQLFGFAPARVAALLLAFISTAAALPGQVYTFTTFAGMPGVPGSADGTGTAARFREPVGVAVDSAGNLYVTDKGNNTIRKITSAGAVTTLAGLAGAVGSTDGTGSAARFNYPFGIAVDGTATVYVADLNNHTIRRITSGGVVSTYAGMAGLAGWFDATGNEARFSSPFAVGPDSSGNIYVGDYNHTIRKIASGAVVTTIAGAANEPGSADGTGSAARFNYPEGVAVDSAGNIYVGDKLNNSVRKITSGGVVTTFAGSSPTPGSADGTGSAARFNNPLGVAVDSAGNVYVADGLNFTIRKITPGGVVTTIGGAPGIAGNTNGPGSAARFGYVTGVAVDSAGNVYVVDNGNNTIRKGVLGSAPDFTVQPVDLTVNAGQTATFTATASGSPAPTYQWYKDGAIIFGATNPSFTIESAAPSHAGGYTVSATNDLGAATSNVAMLSVRFPPTFTTHPTGMTVLAGQSASFTAAASGIPAPTYQWRKDGVAISGATSATFAIEGTTPGDAANYTVVASNELGSATSNPAPLVVNLAPFFTTQPTSATVALGQSVTFTVAASGNPAPTYQWFRNAIAIPGATTASLFITAVGAADAAIYTATATNTVSSATSSPATLSLIPPPIITTQPANLAVASGQSSCFTVAATGVPSPTYQWRKDGVVIAGATQATYCISSTNQSHAGSYTVVVANSGGSVVSNAATLVLIPAITTHPASVTAISGQPATFTVVATGTAPLTYQWRKDGTAIGGATNVSYSIGSTTPGDAGNYSVVVMNSGGTATSNPATLTIHTAPIISAHPINVTANAGQPASFSVAASGIPAPTYQWRRFGAPIPGATNATYSISGVTLADGGSYTVSVTNAAGAVTSNPATLTVYAPPAIASQPASATVSVGQSASFNVSASGLPAPSYQWRKDGAAIAGATNASISIASAAPADAGSYTVVVSNSAGSITSSAATLTVSAVAPAITRQPTGGTYRAGQTASLSVDVSGTGDFEYRWFRNGALVPGAAGATLTLANIQQSDAGGYYVEVKGPGGTVTSATATLVVQSPPVFVQQPLNATVEQGLNTSFSVAVTGTPAATLQWFARTGTGAFVALTDQGPYAGTTQSTLRINAVGASLDGLQVHARATNSGGTTDSTIATLRVAQSATALKIKSQPQSQIIKAGTTGMFSVEMEGGAPVSFQWHKDGAVLPGATRSVCVRPGVAANAGGYSVVVRDSGGNAVTSNTASLTVVGAVDETFDPKSGPNGQVRIMIALSDGGYLAAGAFTRIDAVPRAGIAKLRHDGSLASEFDPGSGPNGVVRALVELAAGRILVVGQFDRFDGIDVPGVVRLNAQGRVDTSFNPSLPAAPANDPTPPLERFHYTAIGLNGGGYLLGGQAGVVALNPSGAVIAQALHNANGGVFALLQQFNGGVIVGGEFTMFAGTARPRLARLTPDLRHDPAFDVGTGPNSTVESLLRSPEGWVYVFGTFTSFNGRPRAAGIARIAPTGRLDESFNPILTVPPRAANKDTIESDLPRRAAGGRLEANNGIIRPHGGVVPPPSNTSSGSTQTLAAISPIGDVSATFDVSTNGAINAVAPSDDEQVAVAGNFSTLAGVARANIGVVTDDSAGSRVVNLSARARVAGVQGAERNLFLGFVIKGPEAMRVLIRAVGPSLRVFGLTDPLTRPQLTIFDATHRVVAENRSWRSVSDPDGLATQMAQVGAFELSSSDDAAIVLNLLPGVYTAEISSVTGAQGVALGELYALDHGSSRLINLSVRGAVGTGDDVLIPGFRVIGGSRLLLMRTIGPGLAQFGVSGTLTRPSMELRRAFTLLDTNQDWRTGFDPAAVEARTPMVGAFPLSAQSADSAVLRALDAGEYTVTARGGDGGTGVALVEIYDANGVETPVPSL